MSSRGNFQVVHSDGNLVVNNYRGAEGSNTLISFERLQFDQTSLAFDLDGNAGTVARVMGAVFGPESLAGGELFGLGLDLVDDGIDDEIFAEPAVEHVFGSNPGHGCCGIGDK